MSPNERWRSFKIVKPITPNREQELSGGIKNALERGETLAKTKQSFLNAGYKSTEIESAIQKMSLFESHISSKVRDSREDVFAPQARSVTKILPKINTLKQKKQFSKKTILILTSSAIVILISAALLGIFWDKIF